MSLNIDDMMRKAILHVLTLQVDPNKHKKVQEEEIQSSKNKMKRNVDRLIIGVASFLVLMFMDLFYKLSLCVRGYDPFSNLINQKHKTLQNKCLVVSWKQNE